MLWATHTTQGPRLPAFHPSIGAASTMLTFSGLRHTALLNKIVEPRVQMWNKNGAHIRKYKWELFCTQCEADKH